VRALPLRLPGREPGSWLDAIALGAIVVLFCAPLFVKLGANDLANDEAIYSYAVDRVLATGDWLTPRAIPGDHAFLEKPPLKFWLVAAPIELKLLPHDEFGMRFVDALAGSVALVYVYFFGRAVAGPLCGIIAVFVIVTQGQLVYVHGIRSNNMESTLLLSYCGGLFHFSRWVEGECARQRSRDAMALAAFFVLGFMTKFVAALFLPLVCAMALAWRRGGLRLFAARWREWVAPLMLVVATTVPWFAYQTVKTGSVLWAVMFKEHVVTRLTSSLDVHHLQPWYFYFKALWHELDRAGSRLIVVLGLLALSWAAVRERSWPARLLLVWAIVPLAIISTGTSKLFHYAYPFVPPLALGAGFVALRALRGVDAVARRAAPRIVQPLETFRRRLPHSMFWRRFALVLGAAAIVVGLWTAAMGSLALEAGGVRLFKNVSIWRPLVVTLVLWWFAGRGTLALKASIAVLLVAALPWRGYERSFASLRVSKYPLRAVGRCIRALQAADPIGTTGIYNAWTTMNSHSYFYYWRDLGWQDADDRSAEEIQRRLVDATAQSPVLMSIIGYDAWRQSAAAKEVAARLGRQPGGIAPDPSLVMLLPGRYEVCVQPAVIAGARAIGGTPNAIGRP